MTFTVIDKKTNTYPDVEHIALTEDWAKPLVYCDISGFMIDEDGFLYLADDCGNVVICPSDRFKVELSEHEIVDCCCKVVSK